MSVLKAIALSFDLMTILTWAVVWTEVKRHTSRAVDNILAGIDFDFTIVGISAINVEFIVIGLNSLE